jgi:hypothetical protein
MVAAELGGLSGFTYIGIDNSGNVTRRGYWTLKEAERAFDYDITLSQIIKMHEYAYREYLEKERERIKRTGQTGGARQDVHGGAGFRRCSSTRNNEDTITDVLRGLLHVEVALRVQLRESLLYNAGTMEEPNGWIWREGVERKWDGYAVTDEVVNPKAIIDELIRCASTGESNPDLAERG